jgi:hypothetical protein
MTSRQATQLRSMAVSWQAFESCKPAAIVPDHLI